MGQHFQAVLKLLADGKVAEAQLEAEKLQDLIGSLQEDGELIQEMIIRARGDTKVPVRQPLKQRLKTIPKEERSERIKKFAVNIAMSNSGKASTEQVAEEIAKAGLTLGTPVPGTVIGNVLYKDTPNWERIDKGVFKYVGLPQ